MASSYTTRLTKCLIGCCFIVVHVNSYSTLSPLASNVPRNQPLFLLRSSEQNTETRKEKKEALLHLLSKVPRNVSTPKELSSGVLSSVRELEQLCPTNDDNVLDELGGNWELIWTAQDSSTEESRRGTFLKYINPLENQAYSINPVQNDAAGKAEDNTQIMGRSNPILPQFLQNTLEDLNVIQIEKDTTTSSVVSSQAIDLKKRRVRNVVSFQINNPFAKHSSSTTQGIITVDVHFRPNPTDPRKVDVKFSACRFKLSNVDIQFPLGILGPTGWLRTSYIDDDIRITRGHKGSVFILNRTASKYQ
jgi:hypothetical protein